MEKIINKLKEYPQLSINRIALILNMSADEVGLAQREYYKPFLKRNSDKWGDRGQAVKR